VSQALRPLAPHPPRHLPLERLGLRASRSLDSGLAARKKDHVHETQDLPWQTARGTAFVRRCAAYRVESGVPESGLVVGGGAGAGVSAGAGVEAGAGGGAGALA
jgi:hypothetical protein